MPKPFGIAALLALLTVPSSFADQLEPTEAGIWLASKCVSVSLGENLDVQSGSLLFARTFADTSEPISFCFRSEIECAPDSPDWHTGTRVNDSTGGTAYFSPKSLMRPGSFWVRTMKDKETELCRETFSFSRNAGGVYLTNVFSYGAEKPVGVASAAAVSTMPAMTRESYENAGSEKEKVEVDPYGFVTWLNSYRAQYRLAPVIHDPTLSRWAEANNRQQLTRGLGHHVMGTARRQNSGWAPLSLKTVTTMWVNSPAHNSALLDPTIRRIGIAATSTHTGFGNRYWTYNAN